MTAASDLSLADRLRDVVARGAWFARVGIWSLRSHFFPTHEDGTPKRVALCGATPAGAADHDEHWRCRSCERRLAMIQQPPAPRGGAARRYDS